MAMRSYAANILFAAVVMTTLKVRTLTCKVGDIVGNKPSLT